MAKTKAKPVIPTEEMKRLKRIIEEKNSQKQKHKEGKKKIIIREKNTTKSVSENNTANAIVIDKNKITTDIESKLSMLAEEVKKIGNILNERKSPITNIDVINPFNGLPEETNVVNIKEVTNEATEHRQTVEKPLDSTQEIKRMKDCLEPNSKNCVDDNLNSNFSTTVSKRAKSLKSNLRPEITMNVKGPIVLTDEMKRIKRIVDKNIEMNIVKNNQTYNTDASATPKSSDTMATKSEKVLNKNSAIPSETNAMKTLRLKIEQKKNLEKKSDQLNSTSLILDYDGTNTGNPLSQKRGIKRKIAQSTDELIVEVKIKRQKLEGINDIKHKPDASVKCSPVRNNTTKHQNITRPKEIVKRKYKVIKEKPIVLTEEMKRIKRLLEQKDVQSNNNHKNNTTVEHRNHHVSEVNTFTSAYKNDDDFNEVAKARIGEDNGSGNDSNVLAPPVGRKTRSSGVWERKVWK